MRDPIDVFLELPEFAVAGASTDRSKYGNKVVRAYQQRGKTVTPINPKASQIEGLTVVPDVTSLPNANLGLSIVTPPQVTVQVVEQALARGIRYLWMQPGAEHPAAVKLAEGAGATVIHGGACVLVALGYRES